MVNSEYYGILEQVHQSFIEAGSQAITTNSYGVTPGVGFSREEVSKYGALAGTIARKAAGNDCLVLGSLGPLVESYRPDLIKQHDEGVIDYKIMCEALARHVDAYLAETMSCVDESLQAVSAVAQLEKSFSKPLLVSYTLHSDGCFRDGTPIIPGLLRLIKLAKDQGVECK